MPGIHHTGDGGAEKRNKGQWVSPGINNSRRPPPGYPRSSLPALPQRLSSAPKQTQERLGQSQSSSGVCCPRVIFISHFLALWQFTYFSRALWVSKTQTRNNNASPERFTEPQPRGGFGNQLLKQVVPYPKWENSQQHLTIRTWWGPHRAVIPAGLHIESCIQLAEPIRGGIVAMNTEGLQWITASLPSASDSLFCHLCLGSHRSKGPKWGWGGGAGSRLVERTAQLGTQRETQGIMEAVFIFKVWCHAMERHLGSETARSSIVRT